MFGFDGSIATSPAPTRSSYGAWAPRTLCQVAPASVVLYSPRSVLGIQRSPMTATYAVLGSVGWTTMRAIALLLASPTFFHVVPVSVERYTPSPHVSELRSLASPVPTQTTVGSDGATAMSPIVATFSWAKTGRKVMPLSDVFMTPPIPKPT